MGKIYIVYGDNDLEVKKRSTALVRDFANLDEQSGDEFSSDDCSTVVIDGDSLKFDEIINQLILELQTPPFLTPKKSVFLRYCKELERLISGTTQGSEEFINLILAQTYDENILLVIEGAKATIDQRKAYVKKLKNIAVFENFENIKITDKNYQNIRIDIIRDIVNKNGKKIANDAVRFLAESLANDSGILDNELEKIITYLGDEETITIDVCKNVASKTPESLTFLFTNALLDKDLKNSIKLLDILIDNGEVEIKIMSTISSELQKILQTRLAMEELEIGNRVGPNTFQGLESIMKTKYPNNFLLKQHPFRAFKLCEGALKWNKKSIANALSAASQANLLIVSGGAVPRNALEQLIFKICTATNN